MENASKALVIAGAILISILIIGLGVFIYNQAAGTVKKSSLNSQEAQAQNNQFEAYFGDHVSATEVKQLLSLVRSNNITGKANDEDKTIYINGVLSTQTFKEWTGDAPGTKDLEIKSGSYYKVQVANDKAVKPSKESEAEPGDGSAIPDTKKAGYYDNGFIRHITITENRDKTSGSNTTT